MGPLERRLVQAHDAGGREGAAVQKALKEDGELMRMLKLTKEDIRRMKYYNMFSVV